MARSTLVIYRYSLAALGLMLSACSEPGSVTIDPDGSVPGAGGITAGSGGISTGAGGVTTGSGGTATGSGGMVAGSGGNTGSGGIAAGSGGSVAGSGGKPGSGGTVTGSGGKATVKLVGFATLNGGTTGGVQGQTVTATTYAQLKSYAESTTAYVIMVQGTISNGANGGSIRVASNKSIIGVGSTAFLNGVGLTMSNSNNIILQNLRVSLTGVTTRTDTPGVFSVSDNAILVNGGDAIAISGTSKNIWIDHCEVFSENPDVQTDTGLYDGLIDIRDQTAWITISWCYLHDHHKGGLVGASDTDLFADRKITFHHNYYNKVKLRVPMYRGATGHFFNNYIVGATAATEIRAGTCVRVEKNYYEPLDLSIYTPSESRGSTERIDNIEVKRTDRAYPANCTANIPYIYSDVLTGTTSNVKTVVPASAGVGKI